MGFGESPYSVGITCLAVVLRSVNRLVTVGLLEDALTIASSWLLEREDSTR